jgi:hypothetical protein
LICDIVGSSTGHVRVGIAVGGVERHVEERRRRLREAPDQVEVGGRLARHEDIAVVQHPHALHALAAEPAEQAARFLLR